MRSVRAETFGPPDAYRLTEDPMPVPGTGEVLIRIRAVSLGYSDVLVSA